MTGNVAGRGRILGALGSADGKGIVRMEDRFDTEIGHVWSALTDPVLLGRWYGSVEGELHHGGEFHAHLPGAGDRTGRVNACEPPRRLGLTMRDPDPQPGQPDETVIEVTLTAVGDQTSLVVEERGMPLTCSPHTASVCTSTSRGSPTTSPGARAMTQRRGGRHCSPPIET